jgi:hypothetical protein
MTVIDALYNQLDTYITQLEATFIAQHLVNPLALPDDYELPVRAYCLLSHAAFEEYFEEVAISILNNNHNAWLTKGTFSQCLITLSIHYGVSKADIGKDVPNNIRRSASLLKDTLNNARAWFTNYARQQNNGTSMKYLKRLLEPIGIDITNNPTHLSALQNLANQRGEFAHVGFTRITNITSPQDAQIYVQDCLALCAEVRDDANKKLL